MITDREAGWLREFILERCEGEWERKEAKVIIITFKHLWKVTRAANAMPNKTERLKNALAVLELHKAK